MSTATSLSRFSNQNMNSPTLIILDKTYVDLAISDIFGSVECCKAYMMNISSPLFILE